MSVNIPKIENPKEFFLTHDALHNTSYDLDFSIFKKYKCQAGCKLCYIQHDWVKDDKFIDYVPNESPPKQYIDQITDVFSYFEVVSIIDDLRFVKDKHPHLFRFYQEFAPLFHISSLTDNAVGRQADIIANEVKARAIHEISISEPFLQRANMKKLFASLDKIHRAVPILKIKMIVMRKSCDIDRVNQVIAWSKLNNVHIEKQLEFVKDVEDLSKDMTAALLDLDDIRTYESTVYAEEFGEIYPVHSEILFLMYDGFYSELKSATLETRSPPFARLQEFDSVGFLPKVLKGKIYDYTRYYHEIQDKTNPYLKYFEYVIKHVNINETYNFIPWVLLRPYSRYYKRLIETGRMVETPHGLLDVNYRAGQPIVSISTLSEHPKTIHPRILLKQ